MGFLKKNLINKICWRWMNIFTFHDEIVYPRSFWTCSFIWYSDISIPCSITQLSSKSYQIFVKWIIPCHKNVCKKVINFEMFRAVAGISIVQISRLSKLRLNKTLINTVFHVILIYKQHALGMKCTRKPILKGEGGHIFSQDANVC